MDKVVWTKFIVADLSLENQCKTLTCLGLNMQCYHQDYNFESSLHFMLVTISGLNAV
jgi:hypothetical protein